MADDVKNGHDPEEPTETEEGSEGSQIQGQTMDDSHVRGVYSFAEFRAEHLSDLRNRARKLDSVSDEAAGMRLEQTRQYMRQTEELYGQRVRQTEELFVQQKRMAEEQHSQRMRVMEQNQAINNQLLMLVASAMGFAALGTQNADQAQMNAQVAAFVGMLMKGMTQVPPVTTATGNPGA